MDEELLRKLEVRLGPLHAKQRLGIERDHEAQIFGQGLTFFHLENWDSGRWIIRNVLKATGLYWRARRNAQRILIKYNEVWFKGLPPLFERFTILHISDLHADMNKVAMKSLVKLLGDMQYDLCVLTGDYRGETFGPFQAALDGVAQVRAHLREPIYAVLGNHDWSGPDSPAAEVLYSARSQSWHMPSPYYTFTAGSVQFFAFDTPAVDEAELKWLDEELAKSPARWKVVYGHYHIYSATRGDNKELIARLMPILKKDHVDVYLNGHDHNLQELKPEGGVHFFVSGGGGAGLYEMNPYDRSIFRQKTNGFTIIEADGKTLAISFVGTDGSELYRRTLTK